MHKNKTTTEKRQQQQHNIKLKVQLRINNNNHKRKKNFVSQKLAQVLHTKKNLIDFMATSTLWRAGFQLFKLVHVLFVIYRLCALTHGSCFLDEAFMDQGFSSPAITYGHKLGHGFRSYFFLHTILLVMSSLFVSCWLFNSINFCPKYFSFFFFIHICWLEMRERKKGFFVFISELSWNEKESSNSGSFRSGVGWAGKKGSKRAKSVNLIICYQHASFHFQLNWIISEICTLLEADTVLKPYVSVLLTYSGFLCCCMFGLN